MSRTLTTPKSASPKASDLPLVDTLARTDVDFWPRRKQAYEDESFETRTLDEPEEWDKQLYIRFLDNDGRLHIKPIYSFANSEETGLLLENLQLKRSSSERSLPQEGEESESLAASTKLSNVQEMQVRFSIEALFSSYADEEFEDGMDNDFVEELTELIISYGTKGVDNLANIIARTSVNPQVISEALRWLGQIKHPDSHRARLSLLEDSLRNPSRWIRDGAALGLASMKDTHAVPYLREAISKEDVPDLRKDLERVLNRLEQ